MKKVICLNEQTKQGKQVKKIIISNKKRLPSLVFFLREPYHP